MSETPTNQDMLLGEMRGQLRELVHSTNNLSGKLDGLTREVIGLGPLAGELADIKARMTKLEAERERRDGAAGVLAMLLKSPALGWLVGAAVTGWAVLSGKLHI